MRAPFYDLKPFDGREVQKQIEEEIETRQHYQVAKHTVGYPSPGARSLPERFLQSAFLF
jgi:hypothetical protein